MTMASDAPEPAAICTCGCCGRARAHMAELGETPGVYICARCALWAAQRAIKSRLSARRRWGPAHEEAMSQPQTLADPVSGAGNYRRSGVDITERQLVGVRPLCRIGRSRVASHDALTTPAT